MIEVSEIFVVSWYLPETKPFNYWQILIIGSVMIYLNFLPKYFFNCTPSMQKYINVFFLPCTSPQIFRMWIAEVSQHLRMIAAVPSVPPTDAVAVF